MSEASGEHSHPGGAGSSGGGSARRWHRPRSGGLPPGLYEHIITSGLEHQLADAVSDYDIERQGLDSAEAADRLALHLAELVGRVVDSLPEKKRVSEGTRVVRSLISRLQEAAAGTDMAPDTPTETGEVLHSVLRKDPGGEALQLAPPLTPLLDTTLLSNARGEPALSRQLESEIPSADGIDVIVAFIRFSGIRPLLDALRRHTDSGRRLRVLTTTFTGTTQRKALDALRDIGADIRISYDTGGTRLHAKAWIFHRDSGTSTAYIGSSNLTHHAQVLGQEWNVRISGRRNPDVLAKTTATFEAAWRSGDYVVYDPDEFDVAMAGQDSPGGSFYLPPVELRPEPFQERLLELIEASRERGHHRNLLVSATGTGKTVMAAIDYARLRQRLRRARLLFVAHREEILDQSLATFRHALREPAFGEKWVGGVKPERYDHVFASIQSIAAAGADSLDPRYFDVVIVDEFHHAAAPSYDKLLNRLEPVELLGLTATPERADGMPILHWFDDRVAAELRLWDAIDQGRLVPFIYYGVHDGVDLRTIPWRRGRGYDAEALANVLTADGAWARTVIAQVADHVADPTSMRALGFCVSVSHAHFMARHFNEAGIDAVAVSGDTPDAQRREALADLRDGKVQVVFSVDLFNEGVDVPAVDTIIMLRPTDSATVFLQQLGRGLRRSRDGTKSVCTVLDFIGHQHQDFRFDRKLRALLGGTRKQILQQVNGDFPYLPSGCHFALDPVARSIVLDNIRRSLPSSKRQQEAELRALVAAGIRPGLAEYLEHTGLELEDVRTEKRSWSELKESVGLAVAAAGPHEAELRRALGRMLHVDDTERIDTYLRWLSSSQPPQPTGDREAALLRMLVVSLAGQVLGKQDLDEAAALVWRHPQVLAELREILPILRERVDHLHQTLPTHPGVPLQVHARYSRQEILAAMGAGSDTAQTPTWREGVKWIPEQDTDIFVVTLDKTDHFSPTTRYRDYAISRDLFHWDSQSTTSADSPTGRRYQEHAQRGSSVFLFARQNTDERAFWFLGPATYVRHEGERPMAITWRLHHPLPGDLYQEFAAA